jgi:hypothetical protein
LSCPPAPFVAWDSLPASEPEPANGAVAPSTESAIVWLFDEGAADAANDGRVDPGAGADVDATLLDSGPVTT